MIIETASIPQEGREFRGEDPRSILDLEDDENLRVEGHVCYRLRVNVVSGELIVRGEVSTDMAFRCSLCAGFFATKVRDSAFECVVDIADESESVDLTGDIREAMILSFPAYPVCRPDCRGLCAQCGANLNQGECHCRPPEDGRWDALSNLDIN